MIDLFEEAKKLTETSLGRIFHHTKNSNIGMISASRGELDPSENKTNHSNLGQDIRNAGFGYQHIVGYYTENKDTPDEKKVKENSYIIFGKKGPDNGALKGFLKKYGAKYGQESVLYKPYNSEDAYLIGTKEGGFPGKDKTYDIGKFHPNRTPEMYSALKNGRTFTFGESVKWDEFYIIDQKSFFNRKPAPTMLIGTINENIDYYDKIWLF